MTNGNIPVDFALVKRSVLMELLIVHLGLYSIQRKGSEVRLKCPFHNGKSDNSMLINLATNFFYCFGCKRRGGVIDFVAYYKDCTFYDAADLLDKWFQVKAANERVREVPQISSNGSQIGAQPLAANI